MTTFSTRQFQAENSQAVCIPAEIAFPPETELLVKRRGSRIIIEAREEMLGGVLALFAQLNSHFSCTRPEFIKMERD